MKNITRLETQVEKLQEEHGRKDMLILDLRKASKAKEIEQFQKRNERLVAENQDKTIKIRDLELKLKKLGAQFEMSSQQKSDGMGLSLDAVAQLLTQTQLQRAGKSGGSSTPEHQSQHQSPTRGKFSRPAASAADVHVSVMRSKLNDKDKEIGALQANIRSYIAKDIETKTKLRDQTGMKRKYEHQVDQYRYEQNIVNSRWERKLAAAEEEKETLRLQMEKSHGFGLLSQGSLAGFGQGSPDISRTPGAGGPGGGSVRGTRNFGSTTLKSPDFDVTAFDLEPEKEDEVSVSRELEAAKRPPAERLHRKAVVVWFAFVSDIRSRQCRLAYKTPGNRGGRGGSASSTAPRAAKNRDGPEGEAAFLAGECQRNVPANRKCVWVVVLLTGAVDSSSRVLQEVVEKSVTQLVAKFRSVKFVQGSAEEMMPGFPSQVLPALFLYNRGVCRKQLFLRSCLPASCLSCQVEGERAGLDELARKVAFNAEREGRDDFNALKWLGHLRRKAPLEEVFTRYIADKGDSALTVSTDEWAAFLAHVDSEWFLEGAFAERFAATAEAVVQPQVVPPTLLELEDGACAAAREQTKKCKSKCEAKDYEHGERPAQDEAEEETPVVEPGILEQQQRVRGGAAAAPVTPARPPSWRFPQLWQHLRREIETPIGAIDLAIFEKGERLREQHAARQHRDRTLQAKSRIVDIWKQRKRVLVENFSGVAAKVREDLGETLDYDFVFPRTPPESGGTETLFRELLQLWKDGWLFRQKMNSLSGGEGATAGAGWMSATSTAVGAAGGGTADNMSKATWATVVKFFRSLKVAVTETDFELLSKLLVWRSYEDVVGVGPGEGATGGVLLVTLRPDGCTVDGFQMATQN
eukprot:g3606.t1